VGTAPAFLVRSDLSKLGGFSVRFLLAALGPNFIRAYPVGGLVLDCLFQTGLRPCV